MFSFSEPLAKIDKPQKTVESTMGQEQNLHSLNESIELDRSVLDDLNNIDLNVLKRKLQEMPETFGKFISMII